MSRETLDSLCLESGEVDFTKEVDPEDGVGETLNNPIFNNDFENVEKVFDTYKNIVGRGYVCREDMERVAHLRGEFKPLDRLFQKYPINSFSVEPSQINLDISTESIIKTAYKVVVKVLKDFIEFIINTFKSLWKYLTTSKVRTQAVDDLDSKLRAIQTYIEQADLIFNQTDFYSRYGEARNRSFEVQRHNLEKKWNQFRYLVITDGDRLKDIYSKLAGVLKTKTPPLVDAIETFINEISAATDEQGIMNAIAKMELFDMMSGDLVSVAADMGYSVNRVKVNPKITKFHSMALHVLGTFRGWQNERLNLSSEMFTKLVLETRVDSWSKELSEAISWTSGKIEPVLDKLKKFDESKLPDGMEAVYSTHLAPFIVALSSTLEGVMLIERSIAMLVTVRDNTIIDVCSGALNVAKDIDKFYEKNKNYLSISQSTSISRYRKALTATFKN